MNSIRIVADKVFRYAHDVDSIVRAFAIANIQCSAAQARVLWEEYSNDMCAGWLGLPDSSEEIIATLRPYFEEVED